MPTTPNGVFVEVTTSSGEVYWATAPAFQPSLPYFRLYDANLAQATVFELIMLSPASTHVGAYLSRQGLATRADPNVGTYIRVNFDEFFAYFGAQFDPSGVEFDPVSGSSLEETITDFGYDTFMSRDAVQDENLGLVFPARVELRQFSINVGERVMPLTAGLAATAEIKTGRRRIIEFLLSPLQRRVEEAGRER